MSDHDLAATLSAALADAFRAATDHGQDARAAREGETGHRLSASAVGGCTRRAAYLLANTHGAESGQMRAAHLGTAIHRHVIPLIAQALERDDTAQLVMSESEVTASAAGVAVPGTLDLYAAWADGPAVVIDVKTTGAHALARAAALGPKAAHRHQLGTYALGLRQSGLRVTHTAVIHIDRGTGESLVTVEPFTDAQALAVIGRIHTIAAHAAHPDAAPRTEAGPGVSVVCDSCPFMARCWGEAASAGHRGAQAVGADAVQVARAAADYVAAQAAESEAKARKDFLAAVLADSPPGDYPAPDGAPVVLRIGRTRGAERLDQGEARERLTRAGIPVPVKRSADGLRVTATDGAA